MPKFRKKPVVIEAVQYTGANHDEVDAFVAVSSRATTWVADHGLRIDTLEGSMMANIGDWIIRGVQGEIYPCKPDIFAATYETVDALSVPEPRAGLTVETLAALLARAPSITAFEDDPRDPKHAWTEAAAWLLPRLAPRSPGAPPAAIIEAAQRLLTAVHRLPDVMVFPELVLAQEELDGALRAALGAARDGPA